MCGIVGFCTLNGRLSPSNPKSVLRSALSHLRHRGPDDEGVLIGPNVGMGMRRLAVIDLTGGRQPVYNETRSLAVVYNGEIYNYRELREELTARGHRFSSASDTEVLVHGYEEWGENLPAKLNGMFTFSLWDAQRRRILLARDPLGIKPLYWYRGANYVAWASEIKPLLSLLDSPITPDYAAIVEALAFGYVPYPRTGFVGIEKLPPGHIAIIQDGTVQLKRYWDLNFEPAHGDEEEWCRRVREALDDAVARQLISDVPLGAFLSGGIDSSAIVATMHRLGVERIATYTIRFEDPSARDFDEGDDAEYLASRLSTEHHAITAKPDIADLFPYLVRHLEEPISDSSFVLTYLVSRLARETVTVILSGVGGDELFCGYRRYLWPHLDRWARLVPRAVHDGASRVLVSTTGVERGGGVRALARYARSYLQYLDLPEHERYERYLRVFQPEELRRVAGPSLRPVLAAARTTVADHYRAASAAHPIDRMLYADIHGQLVDSLLMFTDKMSMAVSLEARVPLLDLELVRLAVAAPATIRCPGVRGLKHLFKKAVADRLPDEVLCRKKRGFGAPLGRWYRGPLRDFVLRALSPKRSARHGLFNAETARRLFYDHLAGRQDFTEHITMLVVLDLWWEEFFE